jgi:hypothetical protein
MNVYRMIFAEFYSCEILMQRWGERVPEIY